MRTRHLAETYFSGDMDRTENYLAYVIRTYGPDQEVRAGPPGVIYGKAGDLLKEIETKDE